MGPVELLGGPEVRAIDRDRLAQLLGSEVRGEAEGEPECGGERGAVERTAEDREGDVRTPTGYGVDARHPCLVGEVPLEFDDILGERVGGPRVSPHGADRLLVGAGGAAESEVDAPRVEAGQSSELLGDGERRVVGQHHATGSETDAGGAGGDMGDEH